MASIDILFPFTLSYEGGFVNDPDDPGGATNKGVTMSTFRRYRKDIGGPTPTIDDLKGISDEEAKYIMKRYYWDKWKADEIQSQSVANALVDWLWCSGNSAIKTPQEIISVEPDGIVGPKTIAALNHIENQEKLFYRIQEARRKYLEEICERRPTSKKFLKGWLRRVNNIHFGALILNTNPQKMVSF